MRVPTIARNETDTVVICDRIRRLAENVNADRERLTADRTYYVATTGSDTADGLTSAAPFLTIQHAYDVITDTLDVGGRIITIQLAAGTYTAGLTLEVPWVGGGDVKILGDITTPTNVVIAPTTGNCIHLLQVTLSGRLYVLGVKLTPATSGFGILHGGLGVVFYGFLNHGAVTGGFHLASAVQGAVLSSTGPSTISGSANAYALTIDGTLAQNQLVTLTGTPAFSSFTIAQNGSTQAWAVQPSGSATGQRFFVSTNAVIDTHSSANATFFPGNSAGVVQSGGQYL